MPSTTLGGRWGVERGRVPNFHAFRHTAASEAIAAGDGAEEVSWQLGHKNSNVTRAVYVQEVTRWGKVIDKIRDPAAATAIWAPT